MPLTFETKAQGYDRRCRLQEATVDAGRAWALETFGMYGPTLRDEVARHVREEHELSLDAQDASGHRSASVYGQFWRGILERFEQFESLPGVVLVRPGGAPYRIPVINGVAVFPWRFASSGQTELTQTPFVTSPARFEAANLGGVALQEPLIDLEPPDPNLSEEELRLLDLFTSTTNAPEVSSSRMVIVAISSSVHGLHSVNWGEVWLTADGYVDWKSFHESLLRLQPTLPVSASPARTFTSGDVPSKFPAIDEQASDTSADG
ncbi:hypothetical protein AB0L64_38985 [Kribbella sp. NPDC051936]|uniref:hypothetical protein n=1 Tax=Kribbella sp. NPDC051936 TaxID=3154946 RepID=UPI00342E70AC